MRTAGKASGMTGRSPDGSGHSASAEPVVSALRASVPNAIDDEIEAIRTAYLALSRVSPRAQERALDWLQARLGWEHNTGVSVAYELGQFARHVERQIARRRRAIATEARRAKTPESGLVHEGAGLKGIAQ